MRAQQFPEPQMSRIATVIVAVGAVLAWIVVFLAVGESARWPMAAVATVTLVVGLLVGTVAWGVASGPIRGWPAIVGRGVTAVAVGVAIGELAALVLFSGSIDRRLDERAARNAASTPAVVQALASLDQTRTARRALDQAVEQARQHRNDVLVVARCEYHPSPECPQTRITGVPGVGPETRTANQLLTDAQLELDNAVATRERLGPGLDAESAHDEQALAQAHQTVIANSDHGLGARWVAMHDLTFAGSGADSGALPLWLITITFFALLYLLPLILRLWHRETAQDRHVAAQAKRERAELEADTAIAIKRAEVRQAAETLWAEQQLTNARLAAEAQTAIDQAHHRRQVAKAVGGIREGAEALTDPVRASSQRSYEPVDHDMYLPIAAEAEAASRATGQLPVAEPHPDAESPDMLPAPVEAAPLSGPVPEVADVTADPLMAAVRWIRPLVPPFVVRAIDSTVQPLRAARQAFEEVEEITFLLRRTHKVTIDSESQHEQPLTSAVADEPVDITRIESSRVHPDRTDRFNVNTERSLLDGMSAKDPYRQLPSPE